MKTVVMGLELDKSLTQKCSYRKRLFEYLWNRFCKLMLGRDSEKENKNNLSLTLIVSRRM